MKKFVDLRHVNGIQLLLPALLFMLFMQPLAAYVLAADITVSAHLDTAEFTQDQAVSLTVTVQGSGSARITPPTGNGLSFVSRGQSSRSEWINGVSSSSVSFIYMVTANKTGSLTIDPISITVNRKTYTTKAITCTVLPTNNAAAPPAGQAGRQRPGTGAPAARLRSGAAEHIGFMQVVPQKKSFYTGELIPFTIKAYFRQGMRVTLQSNPRFVGEDFLLHSIDKQPQQEQEYVKNEPYIVLTWHGTMSAIKQGSHPLEVEMDAGLRVRIKQQSPHGLGSPFFNDPFFDNFFASYSTRNVKMASPAQEIMVKDLPVSNRPDTFTGAVGTFSLAVTASPLAGKVGDPITLQMVITGTGNFDTVQAPNLVETKGWKTYPAADTAAGRGSAEREKRFERAIVPMTMARAIPPVQFSYFDPEQGAYITLNSDPIPLQLTAPHGNMVTAPKPSPAPGAVAKDAHPSVQKITERTASSSGPTTHLAPLHTDPGRMVQRIAPIYQNKWFLSVLALAGLCLSGASLLHIHKKQQAANPAIFRRRKVNKELQTHYQAMEKAIQDHNPILFSDHCRHAIQLRLAEIWNLEAPTITSTDLVQRLPAEHPLIEVFKTLETAGYSGMVLDENTLTALFQTTRSQLEQL